MASSRSNSSSGQLAGEQADPPPQPQLPPQPQGEQPGAAGSALERAILGYKAQCEPVVHKLDALIAGACMLRDQAHTRAHARFILVIFWGGVRRRVGVCMQMSVPARAHDSTFACVHIHALYSVCPPSLDFWLKS